MKFHAALFASVVAAILTCVQGCQQSAAPDAPDSATVEAAIKIVADAEANPPIPVAAPPPVSKEVQDNAVLATVLINNPAMRLQGSGVIVKQQGSTIYVLTASHLFLTKDFWEVSTFTSSSLPKPARTYKSVTVLAANAQNNPDLAVLRFVTEDANEKMPGIVRICPPEQAPKQRVKDLPVLTVGCTDGKAPSLMLGKAAGPKVVRPAGEKEPAFYWQFDQKSLPGRSGGPMVDGRGLLLGICSGASQEQGYYCHTDELYRFLEAGFDWLYEEKK